MSNLPSDAQVRAMNAGLSGGYGGFGQSAGGGPSYGSISAGYPAWLQQVLQSIKGVGASQSQAIQDTYKQQTASTTQDMISRGLGNSTIKNDVQSGNTLDEQKAQVALSNQLAQLGAGYIGQYGMSQLGFQGQQLQQQNQIGAQYGLQGMQDAQQYTMQKTPFGYGLPGFPGSATYGRPQAPSNMAAFTQMGYG